MSTNKTDQEIVAECKRAWHYAQHRGFIKLADDFSQHYALKLVSGKKQTIAQCFIEFCRHEFGDKKRNKYKREYVEAEKVDVSTYDIPDFREKGFQEKLAYGLTLLKFLSPMEKAIFMLHHYYGFKQHELAVCFGVSQSAINQRMKTIEVKLS